MKKTRAKKILTTFIFLPMLVACNATGRYTSSKSPTTFKPSFDPEEKVDSIKVFDSFLDDGYPETLKFTVKEFDGKPFSINQRGEIVDPNGEVILNVGKSLYLYDINDDGYRDFCSTEQANTSVYHTYVKVYDYKNKKEIFNNLSNGKFNYFFDIKNRGLKVFKTKDHFNDSRYGEGSIILENNTAKIRWDNYFNIWDFTFELTSADPHHHEKASQGKDPHYSYEVRKGGTYLLFIHVGETKNTLYPDDLFDPFSIAISCEGVNINCSNVEDYFAYPISFAEDFTNATVEFEFSGVEKSIAFSAVNQDTIPFYQTTLGDAINWPEGEVTINSVIVKEEMLGEMSFDGNNGIGVLHEITDAEYLSSIVINREQWAIEVDPYYFTANNDIRRTYIFKTDKGDVSFETVNDCIVFKNDFYYIVALDVLNNLDLTKASSKTYFFDRKVTSLQIFPYNPGEETSTINNPEEFAFTKSAASKGAVYNVTHSFEIRGTTYFIVGKKKFIDESSRYEYEIISDVDFSIIFND